MVLPPELQSFATPDRHVVSESVLLQMSKGPLNYFILNTDDSHAAIRIWDCLVLTSASSLLPSHRTTICNAISTFVESTLQSHNEQLRNHVLSKSSWMAVFEHFLDRFADSRPKPMRQVLACLMAVLARHPEPAVAQSILSSVKPMLLDNIICCEPRSRIKASLVTLECLLRKDVISAEQLVDALISWLSVNYRLWFPLYRHHLEDLLIPAGAFYDDLSYSVLAVRYYATQVFSLCMLLDGIDQDIIPSTGSLFLLLYQKLKASSLSSLLCETENPYWLTISRHVALENMQWQEVMSTHIFFPLFKTVPSGFHLFIRTLHIPSSHVSQDGAARKQIMLLFHMLQAAKELGIVNTDAEFENTSVLSKESIGGFTLHPEQSIRLSALSLLVTARSTSKPFTKSTLTMLTQNLPYIHSDSDPQYRGSIISLMRKLLIRLRSSLGTLTRPGPQKKAEVTEQSGTVDDHLNFIRWYVAFLESELHPAASYQRHISSLKMLALLLQSGLDSRIDQDALSKMGLDEVSWPCNIDIFQPSLFCVVADLLADPFDDVRESSLFLIKLCPQSLLQAPGELDKQLFRQLVIACHRAESMAASTSRADHADAVARLFQCIFDLAEMEPSSDPYMQKTQIVDILLHRLESGDPSLDRAMRDMAFHGYIAALRNITSTPNLYQLLPPQMQFHNRLLSICERVWTGVKTVLCVDSPEGQNEDAVEELSGPKDLLSRSWRALRESSLLLHAILSNSSYAPNGLTYADLQRIGRLSFIQLAELRHRGAFSTVATTFAFCCQRCGESKDSDIRMLPKGWYRDVLDLISEQSNKLTRRSAGLPAISTGIALADPDGPLFKKMLDDLRDIASSPVVALDEQDVRLPQVHALNCLKDIFINTRLGRRTEPYLMSTLSTSVNCLGSQIWSIRNCGLMLFRALMTRMCRTGGLKRGGLSTTSGAQLGCKIVFENYMQLVPLLSPLLQNPKPATQDGSAKANITTERVFPALELISEKVPARYADTDLQLRQMIRPHFGNPVWGIRDQAARVYAALIPQFGITNAVWSLMREQPTGQNELHGIALCIRYTLARSYKGGGYWKDTNDPLDFSEFSVTVRDPLAEILKAVIERFYVQRYSPFVLSTLLDTLNDGMDALVTRGREEVIVEIYMTISIKHGLEQLLAKLLEPGSPSWRSSSLLLRTLVYGKLLYLMSCDADPKQLFQLLVMVDTDAASWILERISKTLFGHRKSEIWRSRLYIFVIGLGAMNSLWSSGVTVALKSFANEINDFNKHMDDRIALLDLLPGFSKTYFAMFKNEKHQNREHANAALELEGCLLPIMAQSGDWEELCVSYIQSLRRAADEETEFTSRFSAAQSVDGLISGLLVLPSRPFTDQYLLPIYIVLYDLLNDDDEEIRTLCCETASTLLSDLGVIKPGVSLLPQAASESLLNYLVTTFRNNDTLIVTAFNRLLGQTIRLGTAVESIPASALLTEYRKASTVLFEEERQNLFVDDTREAARWAASVVKLDLSRSTRGEQLLSLLVGWTSEGLDALIEAAGSGEVDGVLGWSSRGETYVLGIRVLCAAQVLIERGDRVEDLRQKTGVLLRRCIDNLMAEGWVAVLKKLENIE